MPLLADVLTVAGTTRNAFNYWRMAGHLKTKFRRTTAGVARELSRQNALEIGFVAALTSAGFDPGDAAKLSGKWLSAERRGKLQPIQALPKGEPMSYGFSVQHFREEFPLRLRSLAPRSNQDKALAEIVLTYIHVGLIVERMDRLFAPEDSKNAE
jgi:hypothetical protein